MDYSGYDVKPNSGHTLWFRRITMRASPGREAVCPVVLIRQQRRPFPVRHHSRRLPALRHTLRERFRQRGTPQATGRDFWGGCNPWACQFHIHMTRRARNPEGGSDTTKTSLTWPWSESRLWRHDAWPMAELGGGEFAQRRCLIG